MRYIKPGYYDDFVCIAGACPATCCAGWQIVIDEESLQTYGNVQESLAEGSEIPLTGWRDAFISMTGAVRF